jgi:hypothetical protein
MINFINGWIDLKKKDSTIKKLFDHWILSHGADKKVTRWSIIRNVLHWVKEAEIVSESSMAASN